MQKQIHALTGLRFLAASAIVLDHLWPVVFKFDSVAFINFAVHQLAYVGMTLFFVLSGFIIHYNYADVVVRPSGLWKFFVARFSRLYPLYFLLLVLDFIIYRPPLDWMGVRMLTMTQSWAYEFSAGRFLPYGYHYSVVAWSISTEAFFYVVYPAIGVALRRIPALAAAAATTILCAAALWWISSHPPSFDTQGWFSYISPYSRVLEFATGCALAHAYRNGYRLGLGSAAVATAWIVLFVLRGFFGSDTLSMGMLHIGLLIPTAALIYATATSDAFSWLRSPFAVRMGDASYSMYLLHLIVAERLASSIHLADIEPNWINAVISFVIAVMAIGAISIVSHRFIEVPAQRVLRGLMMHRPRSAIAFGGNECNH